MAETLEQYVSAKQVAQSLGLSRAAVFKFAHEGKLPPGIKIGKARRWNIEDIQTALKNMNIGC